jgi:transcriptional regulator with XRE-family HTH domain
MSRSKKKAPHRRDRHFIAEWREAAGKSQSEVAREIGMSQPAISRIEAHKNPYVQDVLEKMARYFSGFAGDCTPAAMLIGPPAARITNAQSAQVAREIAQIYAWPEPVRRYCLIALLRDCVTRG